MQQNIIPNTVIEDDPPLSPEPRLTTVPRPTHNKISLEDPQFGATFKTIEKCIRRIADQKPEKLERVAAQVTRLARRNKNVAVAISDFMHLDPEMERLGRELDLVSPDGEGEPVPFVCAGICLFAAGVVLGAAAAAAGAAAS